jgi:tryptophan synthase alpha chain
MTRIDKKFKALKAQKKKAFISYIMAGDTSYDLSLEILNGLPKAGVDIIELGLPFTDPMAWTNNTIGRPTSPKKRHDSC